ncbi:MAG: hypothetical protein R2769_02155 [Saprospiraceae bacterium]
MVIEIKRNSNAFFRFFVGKAFLAGIALTDREECDFVYFILERNLVGPGFGILYMMVTWYGGVLYNSILLDNKPNTFLNGKQIIQSNIFLGFNLLL